LLPREKLRAEAQKAASLLVERAKPFKPRAVILFGSYARGDFTESSDIDVCLIADTMPEDELARRTIPDMQIIPKVRVIGFLPDEFVQYLKDMKFLAFDIVAEGIPIYDDGLYRKIRETFDDVVQKHGITKLPNGWRISKP